MNYQKRKWRDAIRKRYVSETGKSDYSSPDFEAWLVCEGIIEAKPASDER